MKNNNYTVGLGLASLFLSIPTPTLIYEQFRHLLNNGCATFLQINFHGAEAHLLLTLMTAANIGLFVIAVYTLGKYLMNLLGDTSVINT